MTKSQRKNLDKALFAAAKKRDGNKCVRCGRKDTLAPSHIYPKGKYHGMRWDLANVKVLCFGCHLAFWHKHPLAAADWLKTAIPKERLTYLKRQSQKAIKVSSLNYEQLVKDLTAYLDDH